ncbi:hypothetical protein JTB14_025665 [Gonioctena quinquepunctata]|nr:hypothetical protein JTB14_025665 [Gonioctena quinquepunctata]
MFPTLPYIIRSLCGTQINPTPTTPVICSALTVDSRINTRSEKVSLFMPVFAGLFGADRMLCIRKHKQLLSSLISGITYGPEGTNCRNGYIFQEK